MKITLKNFSNIFFTLKKSLFFRNKYLFTTLLFFIWLLLFDSNSFVSRITLIRQVNEAQESKIYYQKKIESDKKRLKELKTNNENLEKFAREKYFMKKNDEDIFIIVQK